mmetsp:Transcript_11995/g.18075  ORF Transcript_11995/g.18075 Transcript_11995/m.18075 type:complete len:247 (-) Transcript_11995:240-980(-)
MLPTFHVDPIDPCISISTDQTVFSILSCEYKYAQQQFRNVTVHKLAALRAAPFSLVTCSIAASILSMNIAETTAANMLQRSPMFAELCELFEENNRYVPNRASMALTSAIRRILFPKTNHPRKGTNLTLRYSRKALFDALVNCNPTVCNAKPRNIQMPISKPHRHINVAGTPGTGHLDGKGVKGALKNVAIENLINENVAGSAFECSSDITHFMTTCCDPHIIVTRFNSTAYLLTTRRDRAISCRN